MCRCVKRGLTHIESISREINKYERTNTSEICQKKKEKKTKKIERVKIPKNKKKYRYFQGFPLELYYSCKFTHSIKDKKNKKLEKSYQKKKKKKKWKVRKIERLRGNGEMANE